MAIGFVNRLPFVLIFIIDIRFCQAVDRCDALDSQPEMRFRPPNEGFRLVGKPVNLVMVQNEVMCQYVCRVERLETGCDAYNYKTQSDNGIHECEMFNKDSINSMELAQGYQCRASEELPTGWQCWFMHCKNGGTCNPSSKKCDCPNPPVIRTLPYGDILCGLNESLIVKSPTFAGVFHAMTGRYALNYNEGRLLCEALGATLATYEQMQEAYRAGMEKCSWGWAEGRQILLVMQTPRAGCLNKIGVIKCNCGLTQVDTYCFKA